jgi:hypothetical protein
MLRKSSAFLAGFIIIPCACYSQPLLETENFVLAMENYLRTDLVSFKNVADLDSHNKDDSTVYFGIDYSSGLGLEFKEAGPKFYLRLERNGPFDYDAPLFIHNALMTSGGVIERYRNEELFPGLEEFWLDLPLLRALRYKLGLYTYEVGNGFSLNGSYENYGFTISSELKDFSWRLYYCRPDLSHRGRLGPHIRQDTEQGIIYEPNAANFFALDAKFNRGESIFEPYIGVLADYTSEGKRDNAFTASIKRDILGTLGAALTLKQDSLTFKTEMARNFGHAESSNSAYKDIRHTGYLIYTGLEYNIEKFTPSLQFLLCSGNKVTLNMAKDEDETLTSGKNRAFSYYSPLNKNLGDSISSSNVDMLPIVAMGGGYGLNYGVLRPKTFAAGDFDNLIMPCMGFDFAITEKLNLGFFGYYLRAFERGVGLLDDEPKFLSPDLGYEADLFIDYKLTENTLVNILGGCFFPGRYYKEERDDTEGSLFTPFLRGDGYANFAFQIELAVELRF